eukprot:c12921_g1_i1.p1 GENE.c12921_g1_i1~~c12921_g1_i1.p1  ORF type:complete len:290 (+),score=43.19 c12921_g1_i1:45-914(+)
MSLFPETWHGAFLWVGIWSLLWTAYFFFTYYLADYLLRDNENYRKIVRKGLRCEMHDRILATTHAIIAVIFVFLSFDLDGVNLSSDDLDYGRYDILFAFLCPSMGYFIVDGAVVIYMAALADNRFLVSLEIIHHLLSLFAQGVFLFSWIVPEAVRLAFLTEITTPFLHARWFLLQFGAPKHYVTIVSLCILIGFIIFRDLVMIILTAILSTVGSDRLFQVSGLGAVTVMIFVTVMSLLNFYWTFLMLQKCFEIYFGKGEKKENPQNPLLINSESSALHPHVTPKYTQEV